jgi:predicted RNA-binding Zn-ribbon protein involved in translation (DUF1610 family)
MAMNCAKCGFPIDPKRASDPCPKCGSIDRNIMTQDIGEGFEMTKVKAKAEDGFRLFERKQGEKLSRQGNKAREFLEYDHRHPEKTKKTHTVEEQMDDGSWRVVENEYEIYGAKRRPTKRMSLT